MTVLLPTIIVRWKTRSAARKGLFQSWCGAQEQGQPRPRDRSYTQAIQLNPRYADAYHNRGLAHIGKGNYKNAIADASTAIRLKPKDAEAFVLRGRRLSCKR